MKSTIILCGYLASLASTAVIDPLLRDKTLQSRSLVPANVVFHDTTTTTTGDGSTNSTGNDGLLPQDPDNISACTGIVYEDTSTDRTEIYRDDCYLLSKKVQASPGFWEMGTWSTVIDQRTYAPLISEGTCQFAVLRLHVNAPGSNNSDVAMYVLFLKMNPHPIYPYYVIMLTFYSFSFFPFSFLQNW